MHESMRRLQEVAGTTKKVDIALDLNVGASTVTNWAKRGVSKEGALAAAEKYHADANYILSGEPSVKASKAITEENSPFDTELVSADYGMKGSLPVISWVAAGSWTEVRSTTLEDVIEYIPRPAHLSEDAFGLIIHGQSMAPEFKPNEIIYVEPRISPLDLLDGDLIVIQCEHDTQATFKQLVLGDTSEDMYLKPLNPDWPEQEMRPMSECKLVGIVDSKYVRYRKR